MTSLHRTVRIFPHRDAVASAAAEFFVERTHAALEARGRCAVALSGGSTPRQLYELLASHPYRRRVDWADIDFFWSDERMVPPDHAESNFAMVSQTMLAPLEIAASQIHRMAGEALDGNAAAAAYETEIARFFEVATSDPPPRFDLILLGMGPDGHTASLFPRTAALQEKRQWVSFNAVPERATQRLTFTYPLINAAISILFLVCGVDKAAVLASVLDGPSQPSDLPAQGVAPPAGVLHWYVDQPAASQLKQGA